MIDGRECWDDPGDRCPLEPQCDETNRCLVTMLRAAGWIAEPPPITDPAD